MSRWILLTIWISIESTFIAYPTFHLYHTDKLSNNELIYDCLYYYVTDNILSTILNHLVEHDFERAHQIIPYCRRLQSIGDYSLSEENIQGRKVTFEELRKEQITVSQLYSWSIPMDVLERYEMYLNNVFDRLLSQEFIYNCSLPWFGSFCEYSFHQNTNFDQIVENTLVTKYNLKKENKDYFGESYPCYIHLNCSFWSPNSCLDWHEICDGKIDCLNDGVDEQYCFELETHECRNDEYRCHNIPQCIPEQFLRDNILNPDCLDGTDEFDKLNFSASCSFDPAFRCEEHTHRYPVECACGDGQYELNTQSCVNKRCQILSYEIYLESLNEHISRQCVNMMTSATQWETFFLSSEINPACRNDLDSCTRKIRDYCPSFFFFPSMPVVLGHVRFLYTNNITQPVKNILVPEYVCYDEELCDFLPATFHYKDSITCRRFRELGFSDMFNQWRQLIETVRKKFQTCKTSKVEDNTDVASLFHCTNSSKFISKHRLLDNNQDCSQGDDENLNGSCLLNLKHRFQCPSEPSRCISSIAVRDGRKDCLNNEDEITELRYTKSNITAIAFMKLCDGYPDQIIDQNNDTDETDCEQWPCVNQYTACDGIIHCTKEYDEIICPLIPLCSLNEFPCILPLTRTIACLPVRQFKNKVVDCLGATDERDYCELQGRSFQCFNSTKCVYSGYLCDGEVDCPLGDDEDSCNRSLKKDICDPVWQNNRTLAEDIICRYGRQKRNTFFSMRRADIYPVRNSIRSLSISTKQTRMISESKFDPEWNRLVFFCERGIHITMKQNDDGALKKCFCPPSYYGDRCEYQNERLSLSIQVQTLGEWRTIFVFVITLLTDDDNEILDSDQTTYVSSRDCRTKFDIYLLYRIRPKNLSKAYSVRIDAFEKVTLQNRATWLFPLRFTFLPVHRIAALLIVPYSRRSCADSCNNGYCNIYVNHEEKFCRCYPGWTGRHCNVRQICQCSPDSLCLGSINNQSICLCPLGKYGSRCYLTHSLCPPNTCNNGGHCLPLDERISELRFMCVCSLGYSGLKCEHKATQIRNSFMSDIPIPSFVLAHFIRVYEDSNPTRMISFKKIPLYQDYVLLSTSIPFHVLLMEFHDQYYLTVTQENYSPSIDITTEIASNRRCMYLDENLLNITIIKFPQLRRVKYYHPICQTRVRLMCFYDESLMCLCTIDRHANCFDFDRNITYDYEEHNYCENGGKFFPDRSICPTSSTCACTGCFYGPRCELNIKGIALSLDIILGYHIKPHTVLADQSFFVKVSLVVTIVIWSIGFTNGILSTLTFQSAQLQDVGCSFYLRISSLILILTMTVFMLKYWFLLLSQMGSITNQSSFLISCMFIEYFLKCIPTIVEWLNACVAVERVFVVIKGVHFDKSMSKRVARPITIAVILFSLLTAVHDPIHRQLIIETENEQRTLCAAIYSSSLQTFNLLMDFLHFLVPVFISFLSALVIIIGASRQRSTTLTQLSYKEHLQQQFYEHKHLLITPCILVVLAVPRLILALISDCTKTTRDPWLFLVAYFAAFIPQSLNFFTFVLPSSLYRKEFVGSMKRQLTYIRRYLRHA